MNPKIVYYIIQLLEGMGMGSFYPIYSPWLEDHGLNFFKMGLVNFFYHISVTITDPFTGYFADKFGKRKTFIIGQIFWTATQYIYGATSNIPGFLAAEGAAALGNSLKSDALESWLQNKVGKEESSKIIGNSKIYFTSGQIVTGILAGYISTAFGMQIAWYVSGTFFLAATVIGASALYLGGSDFPNGNKIKPKLQLRDTFKIVGSSGKIRTACYLAAVFSFANKPLFMYWPQMANSVGVSSDKLGFTIIAVAIPVMLGSFLAGQNMFFTSDKKGLIRILTVLGLGLSISAAANSVAGFYTGFVIMELTYGVMGIFMYRYLFDEIDPNYRSTINSIIGSAKTLGGAASLLFMGWLSDIFYPQFALGVGAVVIVFAVLKVLLSKD